VQIFQTMEYAAVSADQRLEKDIPLSWTNIPHVSANHIS